MDEQTLFQGCLLACDIDGTLMSDNVIPPKNLEKIAFFMEQGGMFSLSTGRACCAVGPVLRQLREFSPSVVENGGVVYDFSKRSVVMDWKLSKAAHAFAKEIYENYPSIGIEIHLADRVFVLQETEETLAHEQYEEFEAPKIDWETADAMEWNKALFFPNNEQELSFLCEHCRSYEEFETDFVRTTASFWGKKHLYLEQLPKGVTKASALRAICEKFHIKEGCYFAIGDYYNDVEMIKDADIGAATAEAPQDIRQEAQFVTCSVTDGAVACFIDYLTEYRKGCKE